MNWFLDAVGHLHDGTILLCGASLTALVAIGVAMFSRQLMFRPGSKLLGEHGKLAETVHSSFLAFAVFALALVLTDVRSNLGKADDTVLREASTMARLDRELEIAGAALASVERQHLRDYSHVVATAEWASLGASEPQLSSEAARLMTELIKEVRAIATSQPKSSANLRTLLEKLDDLRQGRLESATRTVSPVFWWVIIAFLLGAMVLNGRHPLDWASISLITLHMAAIGLVIALIVVMDEPFRGKSSVSSVPIINAFARLAITQ